MKKYILLLTATITLALAGCGNSDEIDALNASLAEKEAILAEKDTIIAEKDAEIQKLNTQIEDLNETIANMQAQIEELTAQLQALQEQLVAQTATQPTTPTTGTPTGKPGSTYIDPETGRERYVPNIIEDKGEMSEEDKQMIIDKRKELGIGFE